MSDTTETAAVETSDDSATPAPATEATTAKAPPAEDGTAALGDAGKKALDAMKADRNAAREQAKTFESQLAELKAKIDGKEAEFAAEQAKRETEKAALAKANDRIRKSEVKAAAKGVLADPQDAYKFLDLDSFEVDDDGNVNEDAIASALDALIKTKPYLAAQGGKRFQGAADGGARNDASKPSQWTKSDLDKATSDQVNEARKAGLLNDLMGIKN